MLFFLLTIEDKCCFLGNFSTLKSVDNEEKQEESDISFSEMRKILSSYLEIVSFPISYPSITLKLQSQTSYLLLKAPQQLLPLQQQRQQHQ